MKTLLEPYWMSLPCWAMQIVSSFRDDETWSDLIWTTSISKFVLNMLALLIYRLGMTSQNKYRTSLPPTGLGKSYKAVPRPMITTTANLTFQKKRPNSPTAPQQQGTALAKATHSIPQTAGEGGAKTLAIYRGSVSKDCKLVGSKTQPGIFKAGRIKGYLLNWGKLITDPHILNMVKGCKIDFDQLPHQRQPPCQHQLSNKETETISAEIKNNTV